MIQPAAPPGNSDKESEPVSQEESGPVSQQENKAVSHQENKAVSQQVNKVDGDTIQTKVCQALEKVKQLLEEASRHITRAKVMYKPMEGIFNIRSSGCKPKSWELNYPALAFLVNGGYYADYAGIIGMMGLPVMHHTTWDNLVTWVGTHVEQLANWSCDQVRADIVKRGDKVQWTASFDGFYLTRGHHSNNSSATLHDVESDRIAWFIHRTKRGKAPTGKAHHRVQREICLMNCCVRSNLRDIL